MVTGQPSKGKVIHHMIEQQTRKMTNAVTEAFINSSKRLKAFPKGLVNNTVHLSKGGIRGMWDNFYNVLRPMLNSGKISDKQFIQALIQYSKYTDDFIEHTLKNINSSTTREGIELLMKNWRKSNPTSKAISDILKNI